jgi:hypothetical protein
MPWYAGRRQVVDADAYNCLKDHCTDGAAVIVSSRAFSDITGDGRGVATYTATTSTRLPRERAAASRVSKFSCHARARSAVQTSGLGRLPGGRSTGAAGLMSSTPGDRWPVWREWAAGADSSPSRAIAVERLRLLGVITGD